MGEEEEQQEATDRLVEEIVADPTKKMAVLRGLGLLDTEQQDGRRTPADGSGKGSGTIEAPAPSGKNVGARWQQPAFTGFPPSYGWWPPAPPTMPYPPYHSAHAQWGWHRQENYDSQSMASSSRSISPTPAHDHGSGKGKKRMRTEESEEQEEDAISLLGEAEAIELVEFDPSVDPKDSWKPPKAMDDFLTKHFNRSLSEEEREGILNDFPKPNSGALKVPRLDEQVKEHLKRKGKDPHFGAEKSLYKLQESVLDVAAPLTCLWADLLNKEASLPREDILLLTQRALVLLGTASHQISLERRKIAWGKINPKFKSLASEDYEKREDNLFGPGFLELASKRLEVQKTMTKVSVQGPPSKRTKYSNDRSDLRSFLSKGAPVQYGDRKYVRRQSYQPPRKFQSKRYFQRSAKPPQEQQSKAQKEQQS